MDDDQRNDRLPAIIDYLKHDQVERAIKSGQPIINITINEAERSLAPAPPPVDVATKYAPHLILATWSAIVLAGLVLVFILLVQAIMIAMISTAVCAVAVAAAVRSLRMSKIDAQMMRKRSRS